MQFSTIKLTIVNQSGLCHFLHFAESAQSSSPLDSAKLFNQSGFNDNLMVHSSENPFVLSLEKRVSISGLLYRTG